MDFKKEVIDLNKERAKKDKVVCEPLVEPALKRIQDICKMIEDNVADLRDICKEEGLIDG